MKSPRHVGKYPDRERDLQAALEDGFTALIVLAEKAGWPPLEAYQAVIALAEAHACADMSDEVMQTFFRGTTAR
ncbi:hypothetical protein FNJ84_21515 [Paracoccus sp. M683]|nr:hypothetical protein [Paracoccus sp. M683]TRW91445.1 hypothetical protein FNJ84_21515 [Paracoccus sp. M683]